MRRSRLLQALFLSLALHLGLGLVLYLTPPPKRERISWDDPRGEPVQFEVVERTPPPRKEEPSPPTAPPAATKSPRPPRAAPRPSPPEPPPAPAEPEVPDVPRPVRLFPGPGGLAVAPPSTGTTPGASTGHTWRPGDGPTAGQRLAEERERVQGRVQGFLDDGMASLRVQNGLIDSYFGEMDTAMEKGLTGSPLFAYEGVLKYFFKATPGRTQGLRDLMTRTGRYGATGSPDGMGEPSGTDRLEDVARSGTAGARARSRPSAVDMFETYGKASSKLHVTLELEQSPTGRVLSVKVIDSSGNPLFDDYVVERVPKSLETLGPASEHFAARSQGNVRSVWSIDGHVSFARTVRFSKLGELTAEDAAYISALMPLGLLSGNFEETRGEIIIQDFRRPHFDIFTRLLRVY